MNRRYRISARAWVWAQRLFLPMACSILWAQPQIGGGLCNSSTLKGTYSLTLTGRDVVTGAALSAISVGVGTATFDGLSSVTLALSANTAKTQGVAQTLSGTYSLPVNCIGTMTITTGDNASFTLASYDQGRAYVITGQDGTYAFNGSGSVLAAPCSVSQLNGTYPFNGNGFQLASGALTGVVDFSGLMQFDGASAITTNWALSKGGTTQPITSTGTFVVSSNCTATVTMTDSSGTVYSLQLTITSKAGNFLFSGTTPQMAFTGTGRPL